MIEPRMAYCLFCEDVRAELGNKQSYMGVQQGEMVLAIPQGSPRDSTFAIPKFVIILWLNTDFDDIPEQATVTVYAPPARSAVFKSELDIKSRTPKEPRPEWASQFIMQAQIPFYNFVIPEDGIIEVVLDTRRETIVAGRLRARLQWSPDAEAPAETPAVSLPPRRQSQFPSSAPETKPVRVHRPPSGRRTGRTPKRE